MLKLPVTVTFIEKANASPALVLAWFVIFYILHPYIYIYMQIFHESFHVSLVRTCCPKLLENHRRVSASIMCHYNYVYESFCLAWSHCLLFSFPLILTELMSHFTVVKFWQTLVAIGSGMCPLSC